VDLVTLVYKDILGQVNKVQISIDRIRHYEPDNGYWLAFSGGKDSTVILELAKMAGVKYHAYYNITTVDPPELVRFIRENYRGQVKFLWPRKTMFELIVDKWLPPTRIARYCCAELKESHGDGTIMTGVRRAESFKRSKRQYIEGCNQKRKNRIFLHPIFDWSENDVWDFIRERGLPHCELYDQGMKRIGCVMFPLKGRQGMISDAERWPRIAELYHKACIDVFERGLREGKDWRLWSSGDDLYDWWLNYDHTRETDPQNGRFFFAN